jgi:hypothetical protein
MRDATLEVRRKDVVKSVMQFVVRVANGQRDDAGRDELLRELLTLQRATVTPYARIVAQLGEQARDALDWPAVPSDVFRVARVAAHDELHDARVFRTSGTSGGARGAHHLRELALYDLVARYAARYAVFPDCNGMKLVVLAPSATDAPDSSLSYMLGRFAEWFGIGPASYVLRDGKLDLEQLARVLRDCEKSGKPVALLGTSFAFVHADDGLGSERFALPRGSRIMQTGGFKGRSRTVEPEQMLQLLSQRYGIARDWIVQEYGMTELSSQLYETTLRDAALGQAIGPRRLWVPGWLRVQLVDAERLQPIADPNAEGLLRIDDLANVDTACALQTSDRALRCEDGVIVIGRAEGATPRGCSLAIDAVLGGM